MTIGATVRVVTLMAVLAVASCSPQTTSVKPETTTVEVIGIGTEGAIMGGLLGAGLGGAVGGGRGAAIGVAGSALLGTLARLGRYLRLVRPGPSTPNAVLVGYPKAITPSDAINPDQLDIVSLQRSPADIEGIFRLYRQSLVLTGVQDVSTPWFATAFRNFLDQVGRMVTQTAGAAPANASACQ
jgi:hypothetical protein